jgi:predicted small lipoprotein YifL
MIPVSFGDYPLRLACLKTPALALMLALALAGCGRKGPLEAPSAALPSTDAKAATESPSLTPIPKQSTPASPKQEVPQKPFFLDFIL